LAQSARELFLAQLIPRSVYYREPAILRLELHQVLTAAPFEMAFPGSAAPLYLAQNRAIPQDLVYSPETKARLEKGDFKTD